MNNTNTENLSEITTDTAKEKQQIINRSYKEMHEVSLSQTPIEVEITEATRGGLKCTYNGIPLYMPYNYYSSKRGPLPQEEMDSLIGTKILVKVKEYSEDEFGKIIKISHREVVEDKKWAGINVGNIIEVKVKAIIKDKGAVLVTNKGLEGFVPISFVSKQKILSIEDFININDTVQGKIIEVDKSKDRLIISLKDIPTLALTNFLDTHSIGDRINGKAEFITSNLVFFQLAPTVSGILKMKEVLWTKRYINLAEHFEISKEYELEIINLDRENHRIELSYKRCQPDNWKEVAEKYKKGLTYSAVVEFIPPNGRGAEVVINNEIDAFMPKQRAAGLYNGNKPNFKAKDVIQIKIFSTDAEQHSILCESALRQDTDKPSILTTKASTTKEKFSNFTLADLLSDSSKKALK